MSGQVPNQAGSQLRGLPQQNGSSLPSQIQNLDAHRNTRKSMQRKIYEYIIQRQSSPHDLQPKKVADIVRRLDDVLFRSHLPTKEDYANLDTLESRLHDFIPSLKGPPLISHNQQFPQVVNSSSAMSTMIPTPGMSNLMVTSSADTSMIAASACNSIAPTTVNTGSGSSVGIHSGSFNSSDGSLCNGYQQSTSSFSIGSGGNSIMSSMSGLRITSQMIPSPEFNSNNNQSHLNSESSDDGHGQKADGT